MLHIIIFNAMKWLLPQPSVLQEAGSGEGQSKHRSPGAHTGTAVLGVIPAPALQHLHRAVPKAHLHHCAKFRCQDRSVLCWSLIQMRCLTTFEGKKSQLENLFTIFTHQNSHLLCLLPVSLQTHLLYYHLRT